MKNFFLFLSICFALPGLSQDLKKQMKRLAPPYSKEVYEVLISDNKTKNGTYLKYFQNGGMAEKGQYEANQKVGLWEYYNRQGIIDQQYNFTTRKLISTNPTTGIKIYWVEENGVSVEKKLDELPVFLGGEGAFLSIIGTSIQYPAAALRNRIGGEVLISVLITTEGQMVEEKVAKGVGYGLEEESLRIIKSIEGEWIPGKVDGKPVNTRLLIPVRYGMM